MVHRPRLRLQGCLLVLAVLSLASLEGSYSAAHAVGQVFQIRVDSRFISFPQGSSETAAVLSCPPDPCVPGNQVGRDFFVEVVALLVNVPMSDFAVDALVAWEPWENTLACWNPLATTWLMGEICDFNAAGVQSYQNQEMGAQATANTLNLSYYNAIRSMLRLEAFDREALRAALDTWGTCAGSGCDPLLNTWKALWDAQVGCCGCGKLRIAGKQSPSFKPESFRGPSLASYTSSSAPTVVQPVVTAPLPDPTATARPAVAFSPTAIPKPTATPQPVAVDEPLASLSIPVHREPVEVQRTPPASENYRIPKSVFGSGGGEKTSASFVMNSTQGQGTDLSRRQSASFVLAPGYWGQWTPLIFDHTIYLPLVVRNH